MDELRNVENTLQGKSNSASNLYRKTVRRRAEIVFSDMIWMRASSL